MLDAGFRMPVTRCRWPDTGGGEKLDLVDEGHWEIPLRFASYAGQGGENFGFQMPVGAERRSREAGIPDTGNKIPQ